MDLATFVTRIWPNVKDIYKPLQREGEGQEEADSTAGHTEEQQPGDDSHGDTGGRDESNDEHDHYHDDEDHHHYHDDEERDDDDYVSRHQYNAAL